MNVVTAVHNPDSAPVMAVASGAVTTKAADPGKGSDQVFGPGLGILQLYMRMLNRLASDHHQRMKMHGEVANEAQGIVTKIDSMIADIDMKPSDDKDKTHIVPEDDDVLKYIKDNQQLDSNGFLNYKDGSGKRRHSKQTLTALRANVQKYATQHSDASTQVQLQVQKTMQTYNVTVGLMNSLQTMLGDMTKQFAQAIR